MLYKFRSFLESMPIDWLLSGDPFVKYRTFLPNDNADLSILGRYDIGNQPVIIAFDYGQGRVFIIGTHPEFEENSDRDGYPPTDKHDDKGSDWDLMKKATLWCLKK